TGTCRLPIDFPAVGGHCPPAGRKPMMRGKFWLALVAIIIVVSAIYYFGIPPSPAPTPATTPSAAPTTATPAAPTPADTVATAAAQDAQRLSDAQSLQQALTAYFKDHAAYPPPTAGTTCAEGAAFDNLGGLAATLVPQYLKAIPKDPNPR